MKVTIDRDECTSCGVCWEECPKLFEENPDDGWSQVVKAHREAGDPSKGTVPEDQWDCAREAADGCPVEIIHIQE